MLVNLLNRRNMKNSTRKLGVTMEELPLRANKIVSEEFYKIIGGCNKGLGCCADDECCPGWYCTYFDFGQKDNNTPKKVCLK
jgi:hypothetical protein